MYVCVCNAVTERHIAEAVRKGASRLRDLNRELGVARDCGRCASCARDCLRSELAAQAPATTPALAGFQPMFSCTAEAV